MSNSKNVSSEDSFPPGEIEISPKTSLVVKDLLKKYREALSRAHKAPLSETYGVARFPDEVLDKMTKDDCIDILVGMAQSDPRRKITRNHFRLNSGIKESTWNRYFGTFQEFLRQANIKLSRHVHKLEKEIAKHVSHDHYRAIAQERRDYGNKYEKPSDGRFKTILAATDFHDIECDPFALRVFLDTAKRASHIISNICLGGDVFDLPEFGRYSQDPREWGVVNRISFVHGRILRPLRETCPDSTIDILEGNHESRLTKHLADATPAMKAVLADLHGFTVSKLFGLDEFEVNYVGRSDLSAWTSRDFKTEVGRNYKVYYDCVLAHHFPEGRRKGLPGFNGHCHKHIVWPGESPSFGPYEWHQLGCMHVRKASYTDGERWSNGFALIHVDTVKKTSLFEYIPILDHAYVGGKFYERSAEENVLHQA